MPALSAGAPEVGAAAQALLPRLDEAAAALRAGWLPEIAW
jgi:hypothetical protein